MNYFGTILIHYRTMHNKLVLNNFRIFKCDGGVLYLVKIYSYLPVADPENFGGGGFEAQNLKNSDVFTKIESDFSAEIGNSNFFSPKFRWSPKKKRSSPKLRLIFHRIRYV